MASPFYGARLKIERAKEHINDLDAKAQVFADAHPHTINLKEDPDTGDNLLRIAPADPFPDKWVCILGDAIHNLRSALDHAWCPMVVPQSRKTRFPFHGTKDGFEGAINSLKERTSEDIRRFLLDAVQPYKGGKCEFLLDLHDLDIEDKHRLLIARREYTVVSGMTAVDERGEELVIPDWLIVPPHTASQYVKGGNLQLANYGSARTHVTFGEGMPFQGKFIMPTLNTLAKAVSHLVDVFETIYGATMV